jgi:ubiquinone/menaquinone biosynthesis C-methylase UbiE
VDERSAGTWDEAAATFDEAADHGLGDTEVRQAWATLLARVLPVPPSRLLDVGCGTGTLALLASELGHEVVGVDFSEQMLGIARSKARGRAGVGFLAGDAMAPPLTTGTFGAVLCRHVVWALPDPAAAVRAWVRLLQPGGRLVLIEGSWSTGAGLPSGRILDLLRHRGLVPVLEHLSAPRYWGGPVPDERYVVTAQLPFS